MKLPGVRPFVCLSVRPIVRPPHAAAAGLLLSAPPAGDIDRLPRGRRSAATASGVTAACPIQTIRYDTRCYFNVRSKADTSQLNLPHGTDN